MQLYSHYFMVQKNCKLCVQYCALAKLYMIAITKFTVIVDLELTTLITLYQ